MTKMKEVQMNINLSYAGGCERSDLTVSSWLRSTWYNCLRTAIADANSPRVFAAESLSRVIGATWFDLMIWSQADVQFIET